MLKYLKLVSIFSLGIAMSLFSCKKEKQNEIVKQKDEVPSSIPKCPPGEDPVLFYSDLFLSDPTFEVVVDKFGNNAFNIFRTLHKIGGDDLMKEYSGLLASYTDYSQIEQFYVVHRMDADVMLTSKAEILASLLLLYKDHPDFYALSINDQITVITNVFTTLKRPEYRADNPKNPVVLRYNQVIALPNGGVATMARLSMDEVGDCLRDAVIGGIVNSIGVIRDLYNVITGYNLGFSGIVRVAKSALGSIIGGSAIGALVGFGLCCAWEAIW